jgi:hypothetical protein
MQEIMLAQRRRAAAVCLQAHRRRRATRWFDCWARWCAQSRREAATKAAALLEMLRIVSGKAPHQRGMEAMVLCMLYSRAVCMRCVHCVHSVHSVRLCAAGGGAGVGGGATYIYILTYLPFLRCFEIFVICSRNICMMFLNSPHAEKRPKPRYIKRCFESNAIGFFVTGSIFPTELST